MTVDRIDRDGVEGEVATRQIRGDVVDELHLVGAPAVGVRALAAEGGHLVRHAADEDADRAVLDAGRDDFGERGDHFVGPRVRRDVPVLRLGAAKQIADAAADDPSAPPALAEAPADAEHVGWQPWR